MLIIAFWVAFLLGIFSLSISLEFSRWIRKESNARKALAMKKSERMAMKVAATCLIVSILILAIAS